MKFSEHARLNFIPLVGSQASDFGRLSPRRNHRRQGLRMALTSMTPEDQYHTPVATRNNPVRVERRCARVGAAGSQPFRYTADEGECHCRRQHVADGWDLGEGEPHGDVHDHRRKNPAESSAGFCRRRHTRWRWAGPRARRMASGRPYAAATPPTPCSSARRPGRGAGWLEAVPSRRPSPPSGNAAPRPGWSAR